jgi:hypothetical protein
MNRERCESFDSQLRVGLLLKLKSLGYHVSEI